jgi:hypothetical protein
MMMPESDHDGPGTTIVVIAEAVATSSIVHDVAYIATTSLDLLRDERL